MAFSSSSPSTRMITRAAHLFQELRMHTTTQTRTPFQLDWIAQMRRRDLKSQAFPRSLLLSNLSSETSMAAVLNLCSAAKSTLTSTSIRRSRAAKVSAPTSTTRPCSTPPSVRDKTKSLRTTTTATVSLTQSPSLLTTSNKPLRQAPARNAPHVTSTFLEAQPPRLPDTRQSLTTRVTLITETAISCRHKLIAPPWENYVPIGRTFAGSFFCSLDFCSKLFKRTCDFS